MLKVTKHEIGEALDSYLQRALTQAVVIEASGHQALVVLSMVEYERLQEVDDQHWAACARRANTEGYLDHDHEVRRRLAAALNEKRLRAHRRATQEQQP